MKKSLIIKLSLLIMLLLCALIPSEPIRSYVVLGGMAIALISVHIFMPSITQLSKENPKVKTLRRINIFITIILLIGIIIQNYFSYEKSNQNHFILLIFSCLVVFVIGIAAPKLPVNGLIGIRLPWVMSNEVVWKATHKVMGYCSFPISIIMAVGGIYINSVFFAIGGLLAWALIPTIYSCYYYSKNIRNT